MKITDAIIEFGFDCKVRKLSAKTGGKLQIVLIALFLII